MHPYAEGDRVSIVLDGGQQVVCQHRRFQGMTGTFVVAKQGRAYVVEFTDKNKKVGHRSTRAPTPNGMICYVGKEIHRFRYCAVTFSRLRTIHAKSNLVSSRWRWSMQSGLQVPNRGGSATSSKVHGQLHEALADIESIADNDFIRSKIAEIRPQTPAEIRVIVAAPFRIQVSESEIEQIITREADDLIVFHSATHLSWNCIGGPRNMQSTPGSPDLSGEWVIRIIDGSPQGVAPGVTHAITEKGLYLIRHRGGSVGERITVTDGEGIVGMLRHRDLSRTVQKELVGILTEIIKENPEVFLMFYNRGGPINRKMHVPNSHRSWSLKGSGHGEESVVVQVGLIFQIY